MGNFPQGTNLQSFSSKAYNTEEQQKKPQFTSHKNYYYVNPNTTMKAQSERVREKENL